MNIELLKREIGEIKEENKKLKELITKIIKFLEG
ncbi:hypothetical protein SAMN05446037_100128 [Anaerovirgula multivorans]|uniref:Uncharacterized protein n=1 Tax=Anaerovirgula multivorans TaxID=312168 RepID=A0A238ZQL2_9FIRM|nr:hypothetical protein SAMN05446037_100128 [Anaerovirgula multivorans]